MSDSITEKPCKKCGETKPLTEFYRHPSTKDGHLNTCKPCKNIQQKQYPPLPAEITGNPGETIAVEKMRSLGIFTMTGKMSRWRWQDIVAWGCVRIECKKARLADDGTYIFKFDSQSRRGMHSHLILLMCDNGEDITYHLFPSYHPVFYRAGTKRGSKISPTGRKVGVEYRPGKTSTKDSFGISMSDEMMTEHQDKWELIEETRQLIIQRLKTGTYTEDQQAA